MENLRNAFLHPAAEFGPIPFWFWNDDLDHDEIKRQIHAFLEKGIPGFVIHPRKGLTEAYRYLSENFMDSVAVAVEEAEKLGMFVFLYDEAMYPSGSAGGLVVKTNPQYASKGLRMTVLEAGEALPTFGEGNWFVSALCRWEDGCRSFDSLEEAVAFRANQPCTLTYFTMVYTKGHIRGVHPGEDDEEPNAPASADLLDPEAVKTFIRITYDAYYNRLSRHFGKTIQAIFTDEPSIMGRGPLPGLIAWSHGILEEYIACGGSRDEMDLLFGKETSEAKKAYDRAISARMGGKYFAQLSGWCADHGIALTGHPHSSQDIGHLAYFQLPFQDMVWRFVDPLKENGLEENTIVIFSSDNGPVLDDGYVDQAEELVGDHSPTGGLRGGKYSAFEGGTRVPFIVHWPAEIQEAGTRDALLSQIDFLDVMASVVGVGKGKALSPDGQPEQEATWFGAEGDGRDYAIGMAQNHTLTLRTPTWKYIEPKGGAAMIPWGPKIETGYSTSSQIFKSVNGEYDETSNKANEYPSVVENLKVELEHIRNSTCGEVTIMAEAGETIDLTAYFGMLQGAVVSGDFIEGNVTNMKIPCAMNAKDIAGTVDVKAVAEALKRKWKEEVEILFVGAEGKMEMEKIPALGYDIVGLPIAGLQRRLEPKNLLVPFKVVSSVRRARKIIRDFSADVVVGFGGYASAPVLWAAQRLGVPTIIQEQNSYAGLTNKLLSKRAKQICVAYDNMERFFAKKELPSDTCALLSTLNQGVDSVGNTIYYYSYDLSDFLHNQLRQDSLDAELKMMLVPVTVSTSTSAITD